MKTWTIAFLVVMLESQGVVVADEKGDEAAAIPSAGTLTAKSCSLGFLEVIEGAESGEAVLGVRIAFRAVGDHWEAFGSAADNEHASGSETHAPKTLNWRVPSLGGLEFSSEVYQSVQMGDAGIHRITGLQDTARLVPKEDSRFTGWRGGKGFFPTPVFTCECHVKSCTTRRGRVTQSDVNRARELMWQALAVDSDPADRLPEAEKIYQSVRTKGLTWNRIARLGEVYRAGQDTWFSLSISGDLRPDPSIPAEGTDFDKHWYLVRGKDIYSLGVGLEFISSEDLSSDGSCEQLFWMRGYDTNGYVLATGKILRIVESSWSYH